MALFPSTTSGQSHHLLRPVLLAALLTQVGAKRCDEDPSQSHCPIYASSCTKATCWPDKPFKEQCKISDPNWEQGTVEGQEQCAYCQDFPDYWCDENRVGGNACRKNDLSTPVSICFEKLRSNYTKHKQPVKESRTTSAKYANFEEACADMLLVKQCFDKSGVCTIGAAFQDLLGTASIVATKKAAGGAGYVVDDWAKCPGLEDLDCEVHTGAQLGLPGNCDPETGKIMTEEKALLNQAKNGWKACAAKVPAWGTTLAEAGCFASAETWGFDQEKVCAGKWRCDIRGSGYKKEVCEPDAPDRVSRQAILDAAPCAAAIAPTFACREVDAGGKACREKWSQEGKCRAGADGMVCGITNGVSFCAKSDADPASVVHDPAGEALPDPAVKAFTMLRKCLAPNSCEGEEACESLTLNFKIDGVKLFNMDQKDQDALTQTVKAAFAKPAGIGEADVSVKLSAGSVIVEVTMRTADLAAAKAAVTGDAGAEVVKTALNSFKTETKGRYRHSSVKAGPAEGAAPEVKKKEPAAKAPKKTAPKKKADATTPAPAPDTAENGDADATQPATAPAAGSLLGALVLVASMQLN